MWYILVLAFGIWNNCSAMIVSHSQDDSESVTVSRHTSVVNKGKKIPHPQTLFNLARAYHEKRAASNIAQEKKTFHAACAASLNQLNNLAPLECASDGSIIMHAIANTLVLIPRKINQETKAYETIDANEPKIIQIAEQGIHFKAISIWRSFWDNQPKHYHLFAADDKQHLHAWLLSQNGTTKYHAVAGSIPGIPQAIRQINSEIAAVFFQGNAPVTDRVGFIMNKHTPITEGWNATLAFMPIDYEGVTSVQYSEFNASIKNVLTVNTRCGWRNYGQGFMSDDYTKGLEEYLPFSPLTQPLDGLCAIQ